MKRILVLDIETAPNIVYTWGLWKQDIALNQIVQPGRVLCWAGRFVGEKKMQWFGEPGGGRVEMLEKAALVLDEADVVVHFNGSTFDIPWLQGEFVASRIEKPSPFAEVDLKKVAQRGFYLPSHKLEYLGKAFGIGEKVKHEGFALWEACLRGDKDAWGRMKKYNMGDVTLTEKLYERVLPYISEHPHLGTPGTLECPRCGSAKTQSRGIYHTKTRSYQRYQCQMCFSWFRGTKSVSAHQTAVI